MNEHETEAANHLQAPVFSCKEITLPIASDLRSMRRFVYENIQILLTYADEADYWVFHCKGSPETIPFDFPTGAVNELSDRHEIDKTSYIHVHSLAFLYLPTTDKKGKPVAAELIPTILYDKSQALEHFRAMSIPWLPETSNSPFKNVQTFEDLFTALTALKDAWPWTEEKASTEIREYKEWLKLWLDEQNQLLLGKGAAALAPKTPGYFLVVPEGRPHAKSISNDTTQPSGVLYSEFSRLEPCGEICVIGGEFYKFDKKGGVEPVVWDA